MVKRVARIEVKTNPWLSTAMPAIGAPDIAEPDAEVQKWARKSTVLYRQYLVALAATVATAATFLFLMAQPLLAPLLGDVYFFGSSPVW